VNSELRRTWTDGDYHLAILELSSPTIGNWFTAYIGVPEDHIAADLAYDDVPVDVHGGLTFSDSELGHVDEDGEKPVKWFGWDYNHAADHRREVSIDEPVKELESALEQFREMSAKDIVEDKIRWLPDHVLDQVEVVERDE